MTMSKRHLTIVGVGLSLVALILLLIAIRPGDQVVNGARAKQEEENAATERITITYFPAEMPHDVAVRTPEEAAVTEEITVTRFPAETSHNVAVRTAIEGNGYAPVCAPSITRKAP